MSKRLATKFPPEATDRIRKTCLCLQSQRAARVLARIFDEAFRPFDLTNGQFSLLNALNRDEPAAMAPIAALLAMDRTTLTAALKPLQRRGLVSVEPTPADRRGRRLALTGDGHALLMRAAPVWERVHGEIEARLGAQAEQIRQGLNALS